MKLVFYVQACTSIIALGLGIYFFISEYTFVSNAELVNAKIMSSEFHSEQHASDDANEEWYVFTLQILPEGKLIKNITYDASKDPAYEEGKLIELYYDRSNPSNSEIKDFWTQWIGAAICGLLFLFELGSIPVLYFVTGTKKKLAENTTNDYIVH